MEIKRTFLALFIRGEIMQQDNVDASDYTKVTITTIVSISFIIILYFLFSNIGQIISQKSESFSSSSSIVLIYRLACLSVCVYAIRYMFTCGPGNMRVVTLDENKEFILKPVGIKKFVTFSSWTLLMCLGYFLIAIINQTMELLDLNAISWLYSWQMIIFVAGISMSFLTATVVRYIILPDEVKIGREHGHMFLFHEQIMHNFAAIFFAFEMLIVQPELQPDFAIFGLLFGILYISFAYQLAYFSGGYFVYSFLHPKPKIAPIFATGLASSIALFYLGLWTVTRFNGYNWLSWIIIIGWLSLIVQFRPKMSNHGNND